MLGASSFVSDAFNLIIAPCGSGKTTAAINTIAALASSPRKALFLIDTQNGNLRLAQNEALTLPYAFFAEMAGRNIRWGELPPEKIVVTIFVNFSFMKRRTNVSRVKKIRREVTIGGVKRWISGNTEQEYAERLIAALHLDGTPQFVKRKHEFQTYAQQWFEVFSKPNVELVTATTYERQLRVHIYPVLGELPVEEIAPVDVQKVFNAMTCAKETKIKVKNILNMIFEQAIEDGLIQRNPLHSRSIRITGKSSTPIKPYTVEQMRYLVQHIADVKKPMDRNYLALHALHPLRPEEILGLQWQDIDFAEQTIRIERAVTHPHRNEPLLKGTKTDASRRVIDLVPQIIPYLTHSAEEHFVLGGEKPLTYTQTRKMCQRIQQDINFEEAITPRRFRTTVLTDLYDMTKDIKQAQAAAGHTTAAMTLKHYVKGRSEHRNTAAPIASAYGLEN